MRQSPPTVPVRRKPAAPGFAPAASASHGPGRASSASLLDQLVQAVEGDIVRATAPVSPHARQPTPTLAARGDDRDRVDADAKALAAAGREAVLRGFDLAASAEELTSTSGDTLRAFEEAERKARDALAGARGASGLIQGLARAAEELAGAVDAVASLARQANLLALHATIEAARAGEAGRGFASVAGDVRSLSEEASTVARDLRARIARLSDTAGSSIRAVERIMGMVHEVQPALAAAAASVEDRNGSLRQVAQHATDLSVAVGGMSAKAQDMAALADASAARLTAAGKASPDDLARTLRERYGY